MGVTVKGQREESCVWKLHLDSAGKCMGCAGEELDYNKHMHRTARKTGDTE